MAKELLTLRTEKSERDEQFTQLMAEMKELKVRLAKMEQERLASQAQAMGELTHMALGQSDSRRHMHID